MKYENLAVIVSKNGGDFKVLAFISGNSKAEVRRKIKENYNIRNNGLVSVDHDDFPNKINSNQ